MKRLILALLLVCAASMWAQTNDQQRAEQLLDRTRQLTAFPLDSFKPYKLEVKFRAYGLTIGETDGRLVRIWASDKRWREVVTLGDARFITVRNGDKKWFTGGFPPERLRELDQLLPSLAPASSGRPDKPQFVRLSERKKEGRHLTCVEQKEAPQKVKSCVDDDGLLVSRETNWGDSTVLREFGDYEPFRDKFVPKSSRVLQDGQLDVVAQLESISDVEPSDDLFSRPADSEEEQVCSGTLKPPHARDTPDPQFPSGTNIRNALVAFTVYIDTDGRVSSPFVITSAGPSFDEQGKRAIEKWRFDPATCDGAPFRMRINIEISFRR